MHVRIVVHSLDPVIASARDAVSSLLSDHKNSLDRFFGHQTKFTPAVWLKIFAPLVPTFKALPAMVIVDCGKRSFSRINMFYSMYVCADTFFGDNVEKLWAIFDDSKNKKKDWILSMAEEQDQLVRCANTHIRTHTHTHKHIQKHIHINTMSINGIPMSENIWTSVKASSCYGLIRIAGTPLRLELKEVAKFLQVTNLQKDTTQGNC